MFHRLYRFHILSLALILIWPGAGKVFTQGHHHDEESIGEVNFPISCASSASEFNQAMSLFHHMTYPQARAKFQAIAAKDSLCAMAYWGMAMTLFQPVWPTRPGPADLEWGWQLIQKAKSLQPPTRREQLLIASCEAFFRDPKSGDYWKRIRAWADGLETCHSAFPDDDEISALYALSLIATVPPDQVTSPNNARAADILLKIMQKNPRHPGAMHYLIHANDAPDRERESQDILQKYAGIAPYNPHALHMPTHIYTRLGNWENVISGNIKAADAALQFPAGDHGQFIWDEFPHAIEYLVYAYLQSGYDEAAAEQLKRLRGTERIEPTFKTAFHLSSTLARYTLERRDWSAAAGIMPREISQLDWNKFPWPEATAWFARGLGSIHMGNLPDAKSSLGKIDNLEKKAVDAGEALFARNIRVLRLELSAWIVNAEGIKDSSVRLMTQAGELEASTPKHAVTPGPTLPAYEQLGDLLFEQKKYSDAVKAYARSLELYPRRYNSLLGLARAARATEDSKLAADYYRQWIDLAGSGSRTEAIREARDFLSK